MMSDTYEGFAERYDRGMPPDPVRAEFFRGQFEGKGSESILDCACGTGRDLRMLSDLGLKVTGSDLSEAMLAEARLLIDREGLDISLHRADFRELEAEFEKQFDAVVCLTSSINEVLDDGEALRALESMRAVLEPGGVLIVDQGQSDAMMKNPPRIVPLIQERDFTRLFVHSYPEKGRLDVDVLDLVHTEHNCEFHCHTARLRLRLEKDWCALMQRTGFAEWKLLGGWDGAPYDTQTSRRLIVLARK